jgi:hypothetical protein
VEKGKVLNIPKSDPKARREYYDLIDENPRSEMSSSDESSSSSNKEGSKFNKSQQGTAKTAHWSSSSSSSESSDESDTESIKAITKATGGTPSKRTHTQVSKRLPTSSSESDSESEADLPPKSKSRRPNLPSTYKISAGPGILGPSHKAHRRHVDECAAQSSESDSSENGSVYEEKPTSKKKKSKPKNTIMNYFSSPDKIKQQKKAEQNIATTSPRRTRSKAKKTK